MFLLLGSVCAVESDNASNIENSRLIQDNQLSYNDLEVSSNGSISEDYSYNNYDIFNSNISYSNSGVIESKGINHNYKDIDVIESQQNFNENIISDSQSSVLNTTLVGNDTTLYYQNGTSFRVILSDITGKPLVNQTVTFIINGVEYNRTTGNDGVASININLNVGKYDITASYAGSSEYGNASTKNLVEVLSTISASNVVKFYKNDTQYYAKFIDGNGNPLINTTVRFNINGVFYSRTTNGEGIAKLNINLLPGSYILTAINPINNEEYANNITVLSTISSNNIIKYFKNDTQYYATFYGFDGNPLINTTVRFNINGVFYSRTTGDDGIAKLNINLLPGSYILTARNPVTGEEQGYNITVLSTLSAKDIVMYYRDGTKFTISVVDGQGKPLVNTSIKFNINGVFYNRTTDINGVASLNINLNPNTYTITSEYNGLKISNTIGVIKSNTSIIGEDAYIIINTLNNYTVTLVDIKGNPISSETVYFRYNNNKVSVTTDKNGRATVSLSNLGIGDYNITYGFNGNVGYNASQSSSIIHVINSTSILTGEDLNITYNDSSKFNVTLTDLNGKPLVNKTINFLINGVTYKRITDSNGVASLNINLDPGSYVISYSYSTKGSMDYNEGSNNVVVTKQALNIKANDLVMSPKDGSTFDVAITDKYGNPMKGIDVLFIISGVKYNKVTDESGIAKLNINLNVGYYDIYYEINSVFYQGSGSNKILVNGTIITAEDITFNVGSTGNFLVKLTDAKGNPIKGAIIKVYYNGITDSALTNDDGVATIVIKSLEKGNYTIAYYYYPEEGGNYSNSGQATIHVSGTISIKNMIEASNNVKVYIEAYSKLPDYVMINGNNYTIAQFLYLAAVASININNGNFNDLSYKDVSNPSNYTKTGNLGNLVDYISVAQSIVDYVNSKGKAPESVSSSVGTITFDGLVYAFSRVVAFYGSNNVMPNYVTIKSIDSASSHFVINRVNVLATESELANIDKYLQPTNNCQSDDPAIIALAQKLTAGLTSPTQKAEAIFNYVRDHYSYLSHYDTWYSAKTMLSRTSGNCCDQSHITVALFRAADLPARYVHGKCTFSSGTLGHVWAQVLIGDVWVVADPISTRNSLGVVNNWNINSFTLNSYYISLPF